jgi:carnosine synthase
VYTIVRQVVRPEFDGIFRAGNDLLLEQYLDGVEFDVDLVLQDGEPVFASVSQNWPTAEPFFQKTGLHCPADHSRRAVRALVELAVRTVQEFGFRDAVLHVEGKCTSEGPRIVEVNARMGGTRIHQIVAAVWGVDLIEAQMRAALGLAQQLRPSRRPRCAVVDAIIRAPATGRLARLGIDPATAADDAGVELDVFAEVGQEVTGPEGSIATELAELVVTASNVRRARSLANALLREPPVVEPLTSPLAAGEPRHPGGDRAARNG